MIRLILFLISVVFCLPLISVAQNKDDSGNLVEGKASYYAKKFQGRKTASGEPFDNYDLTAAHRTFPFNTYLNVVNKINNRNVIVRINDRGPFVKHRVIDLTENAARHLGGYHRGLIPVHLEELNVIQLTPQLDSAFHAAPFVDCLGNPASPQGLTISLWSTIDLLHAVYVANDLYLKEDVKRVYIGHTSSSGKKRYHVLISHLPDMKTAQERIRYYEDQGFMRVNLYDP